MKIKKYLILAILLLCCIKLLTFALEVIEDEQHDTIVEKVFEDNSYVESYIMETEKGIQTRSSKKSLCIRSFSYRDNNCKKIC